MTPLLCFSLLPKELYQVLNENEYSTLVMRYNLFHFKLKEALTYLSLQSFAPSHSLLHSTKHDVHVISELVHVAVERMHTSLSCAEDVEASSFWLKILVGPVVTTSLILVAILLIKPKSTNKSKWM
jgi:hypothetical protein